MDLDPLQPLVSPVSLLQLFQPLDARWVKQMLCWPHSLFLLLFLLEYA